MDPIEKLSMEPFIDLEIGQIGHLHDKQISLNNPFISKCKDLLIYISKQPKNISFEDVVKVKSDKALLKSVNMRFKQIQANASRRL